MPYINKCFRREIDRWLELMPPTMASLGVLNYTITKLLLKFEPISYQDFNALVGVLECVKLELYRRLVAPYENWKKESEGDIYPED